MWITILSAVCVGIGRDAFPGAVENVTDVSFAQHLVRLGFARAATPAEIAAAEVAALAKEEAVLAERREKVAALEKAVMDDVAASTAAAVDQLGLEHGVDLGSGAAAPAAGGAAEAEGAGGAEAEASDAGADPGGDAEIDEDFDEADAVLGGTDPALAGDARDAGVPAPVHRDPPEPGTGARPRRPRKR